jgi:hypothetical protein
MIALLRGIIGWPLIIIGAIITPLPIPIGLILITIGVLIVGTRSRGVRLAFAYFNLMLRRWARMQTPIIGDTGRFLLRKKQEITTRRRRQRMARLGLPAPEPVPAGERIDAHHDIETPEDETAR